MGTSSLIRAEQNSLNLSSLATITETVRDLKNAGFNVIIVSRQAGAWILWRVGGQSGRRAGLGAFAAMLGA